MEKLGIVKWLQSTWVSICIYFLACFFTSALHYGWQQYQMLLIRDGAYNWKCSPGDELLEENSCQAQQDAVGALYSVASGCEYISAAVGGVLLDHLGPRKTAIIGEITWAVGTLCLAFASDSARIYPLAMALLGLSVNITCFPSLTMLEMFPKWKGLMVAVMLGSQNAATGIPPVLYKIMQVTNCSLRDLWLIYLVAIWVPVTLLYAIALPGNHNFRALLRLQRKEMLAQQGDPATAHAATAHEATHRHHVAARAESDKASTSDGEDDAFTHRSREVERDVSTRSSSTDIEVGHASWAEFFTSISNIDVPSFGLWFLLMMLIFAYPATVMRQAFGDAISDYNAYFMPTQAVWAFVVGLMCDFLPTTHVMMYINAVLTFVFACSLAPHVTWLQYLSTTVFTIIQCAIFEVKFTYTTEMFDPYNMGKIVGVFGVLGGVGTFVNIPIAKIETFKYVFITYLVLNPILGLLALYLRRRQKKGVCYKQLPQLDHHDVEKQIE